MENEHYFESDEDGFLTGEALSSDELLAEWEEIHESLDAIQTSVNAIEKAILLSGGRIITPEAAKTIAEPIGKAVKKALRASNTPVRTTNRKEAEESAEKRETASKTIREKADKRTAQKAAKKTAEKSVVVKVETKAKEGRKPVAVPARKTAQTARVAVPVKVKETADRAPKAKAEKAATPKKPTVTKQPRTPATAAEAASLGKNGRDARGRFLKKNGVASDGYSGASDSLQFGKFAEKIAEAAKDAAETVGEADPTVTAIQEVAEPLSRGFSFIQNAWGDSEEAGWLRKIFRTMGKFRKEQTAFNKAEKKTLEGIEDNTEGGRGEAGGLNLPIIGKLSGFLAPLSMLLKRIPVIGSAIAAIGGLFGVLDSEWDETTTREEKDRRTGKAVGGAGGAIGGMFAGAKLGAMAGSFAGPIGTAIGGLIGTAVGGFFGSKAGDIIGETVGGWVAELRNADIPGMISKGWTAFVGSIEKTWDDAIGGLTGFWDNATNAISSWIQEKTGIDVKALSDTVSETVSSTVKSVKNFFGFATEKKTETPSIQPSKDTKAAEGWTLGSTSAQFESGGRGAGTISSGRGDAGGASYGTYQLSSKTGTLQSYLDQSGYGRLFAGLKPGTKEFNDQWREVAKNNEGFEADQHDFIKRTHYDKAVQGLSESGIDLSKRGKAVQDALWSTSVQFGAGSYKSKRGAVPMFKQALAGKDVASMSDADIVAAIQDYKLANNDKLFASSSAQVRAGTAKRAVEEKKRLVALAEADKSVADTVEGKRALAAVGLGSTPKPLTIGAGLDATVNQADVEAAEKKAQGVSLNEAVSLSATAKPTNAAVATLNVPSVRPPAVVPPQSAQPVSVVTPLASNRNDAPTVVKIEKDAGQDVEDRGVAHIVTGGLK